VAYRDGMRDPVIDGRRLLWIDASGGIAGDMFMAALLDAGAELDVVQAAVDAVAPGAVRLDRSEVTRAGLRASALDVRLLVEDQPHRRWSLIRDLLLAARLDARTRERALATFDALARAEARAHGVAPDDVEFHEIGSWDSIADVVGVCAALGDLAVDEVVLGELALGSGSTRGAHGLIPVPAPAVLDLCRGWAVGSGELGPGSSGELATPTGVALATPWPRGAGRCRR
jgi:pyridinium-3,5-bisthiocarboxylic acid mononucleotide nickel chelatase